MKVFFDCEFTGLHQQTTLVSIALIAESGKKFYAELSDYDEQQLDPWLIDHVINGLLGIDGLAALHAKEPDLTAMQTTRAPLASLLQHWLGDLGDMVTMIGDVPAYDWMLFCELYGGANNTPPNVHYYPLDFATVLAWHRLDPDIDRQILCDPLPDHIQELGKHNALLDAHLLEGAWKTIDTNIDLTKIF